LGKAQKNIFTAASIIPQLTNTTAAEQPAETKKEKASAVLTTYSSSTSSSSSVANMNIATNKPFVNPHSTRSSRSQQHHQQQNAYNEPQEEEAHNSTSATTSHTIYPLKSKTSHHPAASSATTTTRSVRFEPSVSSTENVENVMNHNSIVAEEKAILQKVPSNLNLIGCGESSSFLSSISQKPATTTTIPVTPLPMSSSSYSFLNSSSSLMPNSNQGTMNEKLQQYLIMKRNNIGSCQRRNSVLQQAAAVNVAPVGSLFHPPSRPSLMPSQAASFLEPNIGMKRDVSQINSERSFINDISFSGNINSTFSMKKSRNDYYSSVNLTSALNNAGSKKTGGWR
jgi:chemotaxis protein histidine kinase CheA